MGQSRRNPRSVSYRGPAPETPTGGPKIKAERYRSMVRFIRADIKNGACVVFTGQAYQMIDGVLRKISVMQYLHWKKMNPGIPEEAQKKP